MRNSSRTARYLTFTSSKTGGRAKATRNYEKSRKEALDRISDVFILYDIKMAGRERLDGHDTVVLTLEPKRDPRPVAREEKWMQCLRCRAWISESDELVRLNVEAIRDANLGFGLLARMNKAR